MISFIFTLSLIESNLLIKQLSNLMVVYRFRPINLDNTKLTLFSLNFSFIALWVVKFIYYFNLYYFEYDLFHILLLSLQKKKLGIKQLSNLVVVCRFRPINLDNTYFRIIFPNIQNSFWFYICLLNIKTKLKS